MLISIVGVARRKRLPAFPIRHLGEALEARRSTEIPPSNIILRRAISHSSTFDDFSISSAFVLINERIDLDI